MTLDMLNQFRGSTKWIVGKDAPVTMLKPGADGRIDAHRTKGEILVLVSTADNGIPNPNLNGTLITRLDI